MKRNILHLTYDMRIGGTEQVIKNLIEGSDAERFNMSIFCIEEPIGPFGQILIKQGTTISSHQRKQGFDIQLIKVVRQYIKKNKIDILHCHQYTPWVYGAFAAVQTNVKVIFTEHGRFYPDRSSWKRKFVNPLLVKLTNKITSISHATKQSLVDFEYIPEHRIEVIYNGIQEAKTNDYQVQKLKKELAITDDTIVFGTIARLDPIKNHEMMIAAFCLVLNKHPDSVLIIVGDGEERAKLEGLAEKSGFSKNIIFTGYVSIPYDHLSLVDIFLLTSFSEGTSMTLLEAMSLSKPCVVTAVGGNPEIVTDNISGFVVPSNNPELCAAACCQLIENSQLREQFGHESKKDFVRRFSINTMVDNFASTYCKLMTG